MSRDSPIQKARCDFCRPVTVRRVRHGKAWVRCCNRCFVERFPDKRIACGDCGKKRRADELVADDEVFLICYECDGELSEGDGTEETLELYGWDREDIDRMTNDEKAEAAADELAKRSED